MRVIKFRLWDKKYSTFDYNASPDVFIGTDGKVYDREERTLGDQRDIEYVESDNYVISQWTGLHDKNGKEIYEGDIIYYNIDNGVGIEHYQGIVKWADKEIHCRFEYMIEYLDGGFDSLSRAYAYNENLEVIGNIYEYNHLLEGEVNVKRD